MKIDVYSHIVPRKYWDTLLSQIGNTTIHNLASRTATGVELTRTLWDLEQRFRIMDKYEGLVQVLTPSGPPLELIASPKQAAELARLYDDTMAEVRDRYPDRFIAAVAYLPLNNIDAALKECRRAIEKLGFKGVLIHTPIYENDPAVTKPIDIPELMPLYEMMSDYDLPIWLHPRREFLTPDYTTERMSKYLIHQMFGWPYETTVAMSRLVYSGVFEKYPNLKIITHHCGAMVPFFADRITNQCEWYKVGLEAKFIDRLKRPPVEYFRQFYNDTAICGNTAALMCGYEFFGAGNILFGTDMPYDAELGDKSTRDVIQAIEQMKISKVDKQKIFEGNARKLLKLD